jgi:hypothetical protein
MTAAERIYELVKTMPDEQVHQVLAFVEALGTKADLRSHTIPKGTLTGLRGIAKQSEAAPTDEEVREAYTNYLVNKYQ